MNVERREWNDEREGDARSEGVRGGGRMKEESEKE